MLLPFGIPPNRVPIEVFGSFVADLLGSSHPGDDARVLARVAMRRWRATSDHRWLLQIVAIDSRLEIYAGSRRRGWASVANYQAWRAPWLRAQLQVLRRDMLRRPRIKRHKDVVVWPGLLSEEGRASARRSLETAMRRADTAAHQYQRSRWELRAREYRSRLLEDALARYELGREAVDGRSRKAAGRAREDALALGWKEPT